MGEDVETLKRRMPLLDYLRQHNWTGYPASRSELVGLCPLHEESRPSFYVNTRKDVFYCHGCGRGGDLIRLVQLWRGLSFRQSLACLDPEIAQETDSSVVLEEAAAFYQQQPGRCPEALDYLHRRGVHDPALISELDIGYAPGGILRRHLTAEGHSPLATATCIGRLFALRTIFHELARTNNLAELAHLLLREDIPRSPHTLPRPLTAEQDQLLQQEFMRRNDLGGNVFLLLRSTGMRIGECVDLSYDCLRATGPNQWAPKDNISLGCDFDELKPVFSSLLLESLLHPQVSEGFLLSEDGLVIGLAGGEHVEQDAGEFVRGGGDGSQGQHLTGL